jgi:glycosyltransferase involved in cell wall biosynthesis
MRVLQVTAIPVTAVRFVAPLARALEDAGFEVEFATGPGRWLDSLEALGYCVHRLPISRNLLAWRNLHAKGALRSLIRGGGFQVVHAHTPAAAAVTRPAARGLGARTLYTMHGSAWGQGASGVGQALFTAIERWQGRWTDLIFTVNAEDAADCVGRAGMREDRVCALPAGGAGVAPEFFLDAGSADSLRDRTRRQLGISSERRVVSYIGRTTAAKGMGTLAGAFESVAEREERALLLVVGGALEGDRDAYSRERFLGALGERARERVIWLGFQESVVPLAAAADLVVLPSLREGFGMSLAEAAALGRPAVATDTRGGRAVIEPGVTGLLVPVGEAGELADAVLRLLRDPEEATRMGAAGQRRAGERFTREAVLSAYLEEYEALREPADRPETES